MSYRTTTSYGTWSNRVNTYSTGPDADILDFISGGDTDWQELLDASGALAQIQSEYRDAINAALPSSVSLSGDEFIGPYETEDDEFADYPTDEDGNLDFKAIVEDVDLSAIVEWHEPATLDEIGRNLLKSQAANPGKAASGVLSRLGVKPFAYHRPDGEPRAKAYYYEGQVREALEARPGRGTRTDLKGSE